VKPRLRGLVVAALLGIAAVAAVAQTPPPASSPAAAAALAPSPPPSPAAATPLAGPDLLAALRAGGYILYFRHTATDFGENDAQMTSYENCATQRNLTDAGRADARAIGAALRDLGIPVSRVLASPYCRTLETGRLIFGHAETSVAVRGGPAVDNADRYAELRTLLSTPVPRGTNLAIASHGNPYRAVAGGPYLAEGEAAIIAPRGSDGFHVVARVTKDEWATLARNAGRSPG
jgi:hypothetical protein